MGRINTWLAQLTKYWQNKDIESIMDLFVDDIDYWETPFVKVADKKNLEKEWRSILTQSDIKVSCNVFSSADNKFSITWDLTFIDARNTKQHFRGVYLIKLNKNNKCEYFYQCCE